MAVAPSIKAMFAEANIRWPSRSKASDGTYGDRAHASRRSDHNPGARGLVHAGDLTHDLARGVDCNLLAEHLRQRTNAGKERRVSYIIWRSRIYNPSVSREWRRYDGSNPHDKHMHVSIKSTPDAENDTSPWFSDPASPIPVEAQMTLGIVDYLIVPHARQDDKGRLPCWGVNAKGHVYAFNGAPVLGGLGELGIKRDDIRGIEWYPHPDSGVPGYVLIADDFYKEADGSANVSTYAFFAP